MNKKTKSFFSGLIAITWAMFLLLGCSSPSSDSTPDSTPSTETVNTTGISISSDATEIDATGETTLRATVTPAESTESVSWTITNGSDKATLSATSGITVKLTGKNDSTSNATVTVKATSGSKSETKNITVKGKAENSTTPTTTEDNLPKTSVAMAKAMVIGWNLGNTLDADKEATKTNKGLSTETSWGMPKTTQNMIKAVAKKGFKTIRIPVSWHTHITDSNYTIDSQWMARVKTVVDWAIDENMYVILNVHHDDFSDGDMSKTYGYSVSTNASIQTTSKKYLGKVWTQIATTFKDYDNRLVFEVLNEPRAIGTAWEWWENNPQTEVGKLSPVIKEYEETCITAIRNTGASNSGRYIMVPTYAANSDMATGWSMPADTAKDRLILSTHAYTPSDFALQGSATTFSSSAESAVTSKFDSLYSNYVSKGIGVVIGEASVSNKNNDTERAKWIKKYFALSNSKGIPVVLWDNMTSYNATKAAAGDNGEFHDWFNRNDCTWWHESLVTSMIDLTK